MRLSIHIDASDQKSALKQLKIMRELIEMMAEDGYASLRSPEDRSCLTLSPMTEHRTHPGEPPPYEVLGQTEEGQHVVVSFHQPTMEEIRANPPKSAADLMGYWRERDGTRHARLKTWTHLPFPAL